MRAIAPRTGVPEVTIAEEQEEYLPITIARYFYDDGTRVLLTRWTFTQEERAAVARGEDIYVGQMNFGGPMTPLIVQCGAKGFDLNAVPRLECDGCGSIFTDLAKVAEIHEGCGGILRLITPEQPS